MANRQGPRPQLVSATAIGVLVLMQHATASAQETPPTEPPPPAPGVAPAAPATSSLPEPTAPAKIEAEGEGSKRPLTPGDLGNNPHRTVGRHQFIFPQYIDSAFIATYFGLRIRLADFRASQLPTENGPIDIEAVSFSQGFDFGLRITDWLGLFVSTGVRSLVSTNLRSLVYEGATYDFGGNLGFIVRLLRSDRTGTLLSLRGSLGGSSGQASSLAPLLSANSAGTAVRDILRGNFGESLRTPISSVNYGGAFTMAQAISPMFGVQAVAGVGWTHTKIERWDPNTSSRPETNIDGVTYRFGGAFSADFNHLNVPVAVMVEYLASRQTSTSQVSGGDELDIAHTLFGGVYYSGRPNLQLGLGGGRELNLGPTISPQGRSERPRLLFGQFVLRYVW